GGEQEVEIQALPDSGFSKSAPLKTPQERPGPGETGAAVAEPFPAAAFSSPVPLPGGPGPVQSRAAGGGARLAGRKPEAEAEVPPGSPGVDGRGASDNIPKADEIRTLVKDTWDTRMAKLRLSADSFVRQQEAHAKLDNLTLMEINTIGTFLTQALDHMYKLRTNLQPAESSQSQDF
uniref:GINS complex subunit 2 n=1 Tax=Anser brachyrhynchus TaxID=132585 RepID=A0A8B9B7S6_9AVES